MYFDCLQDEGMHEARWRGYGRETSEQMNWGVFDFEAAVPAGS